MNLDSMGRDAIIRDMEPLLTMEDAANILKVTRSTIYRYINQGMLQPVKMGGRTMFKQKDLEAFIESLPQGTRKKTE